MLRRESRAPAAARMASESSVADSSSSAMSASPDAMAEQTTTGTGSSAMSLRKNDIPSIRGMSKSRTITCGLDLSILPMAMMGSDATDTDKSSFLERTFWRTSRTTAESSTTRTRIGSPGLGMSVAGLKAFSISDRRLRSGAGSPSNARTACGRWSDTRKRGAPRLERFPRDRRGRFPPA